MSEKNDTIRSKTADQDRVATVECIRAILKIVSRRDSGGIEADYGIDVVEPRSARYRGRTLTIG